MARKLDERQQADLTGFVNEIAERAGYASTAEWARESGYPAPNLSNLRNGRGSIDGYNLLRLIRAAADRMDVPADLLAAGQAAGDSGEVIQRLEDLTELVTVALAELGIRPRAEDQLPTAEEPQAAAVPPAPRRPASAGQRGSR